MIVLEDLPKGFTSPLVLRMKFISGEASLSKISGRALFRIGERYLLFVPSTLWD